MLLVFPPFGGEAYVGIAEDLLPLEGYQDARQILRNAVEKRLDIDGVHKDLYALGFVAKDAAAMDTEAKWLESRPEYANLGLSLESDTQAYFGHLVKARVLSSRAVDAGVHSDNREAAALWRANSALREALFGDRLRASHFAAESIKMAPASQSTQIEAALAFALAGDRARALSFEQDLDKRFPLDTQVQMVWLPTIRAQLALLSGEPERAVSHLQKAVPVQLGSTTFSTSISCLYALQVRGDDHLALRDGNSAAREFQKILHHPGIVWNYPTGALARLGLPVPMVSRL